MGEFATLGRKRPYMWDYWAGAAPPVTKPNAPVSGLK